MLTITVPGFEYFDDCTQTFGATQDTKLQLEHSLISVSKWEAKWKKPFLDRNKNRTTEEVRDYVRCMTLTQNVDPSIYYGLTEKNFKEIDRYINDPMTATWFGKNGDQKPGRTVITSEVIYWQMISLGIPFECQKWHLNRLTTLIRVCSEKNKNAGNSKKMSNGELRHRAALNEMRKRQLHSSG